MAMCEWRSRSQLWNDPLVSPVVAAVSGHIYCCCVAAASFYCALLGDVKNAFPGLWDRYRAWVRRVNPVMFGPLSVACSVRVSNSIVSADVQTG